MSHSLHQHMELTSIPRSVFLVLFSSSFKVISSPNYENVVISFNHAVLVQQTFLEFCRKTAL